MGTTFGNKNACGSRIEEGNQRFAEGCQGRTRGDPRIELSFDTTLGRAWAGVMVKVDDDYGHPTRTTSFTLDSPSVLQLLRLPLYASFSVYS